MAYFASEPDYGRRAQRRRWQRENGTELHLHGRRGGGGRLCDVPATPNDGWDPEHPEIGRSSAPFRVYNIGNGAPVDLMDFIEILGQTLGREAE